jgi:hypothetical protein
VRRLATVTAVASVFAAAAPNIALAAPAPTGATGIALDARVELAWQPVPTAGGYAVYRGTSPSAITDLLTPGGIITTSYTDTTAINGTTYYYAVRSLENGMQSPNSARVRATPRVRGCSTGNTIRLENCFPGDPGWKLTNPATFGGIDGFTSANSINKGESIDVKIDVDGAQAPTPVRVEVYRTGFYNDVQARLFSVVDGLSGAAQPACTTDDTTGLYDCSNWSVTATVTTTTSWPSGIYLLKVVREDNGADNHVLMIVRDDARTSDILYGAAVATYQAYNQYGGRSLYDFNSNGPVTVAGTPRAVKVSFDRPYAQSRGGDKNWFTTSEHQLVSWLEEQSYDVGYQSDTDLERNGARVLNHRLYVLPAHDEYYSANMRAALEQARDNGKHLLSVGANQVYWKIRFENGSGGTDRIQVCYKSTESGGADPTGIPTGTWRDPAGANRPENALLGSMYVGDNVTSFPLVVSEPQGKDQIYRGTSLATQPAGGSTSVGLGLVGWEWDGRVANGFEPAGVTTLASSPVNGDLIQKNGQSTTPGSTTTQVVRYQAPSGAIVLNVGTNQWTHGLTRTAYGPGEPDLRIQQTTMNILTDMGATPQTPATGLQAIPTPAGAVGSGAGFATAPVPSVTEQTPAAGATGVATTAQPRATFSVDMDASTVTPSSFTLTAAGSAAPVTATVAYDAVSRTVTLAPTAALAMGTTYTASLSSSIRSAAGTAVPATSWSFTIFSCPCAFFAATAQPASQENAVQDGRTGAGPWSYELGMKFSVDQPTQLSAVRFWKTPGERGVHTGTIWSSAGSVIAQAEFALETASGWQQQPLASPVTLQPGQTYVVSVNANDFFAYTSGGLASQVVAGPLRTVAGANGVFGSAAGVFPAESFNNSNYFVDVRAVADGTPAAPSVTAVTPRSLAAGVAANPAITATFSTAMDVTSISSSTFTLAPAGGAAIAATVTYDAATRTASLTPSVPLASGKTYTALLAPTIRDAFGRALDGPATWTFTTTSNCVCTLFAPELQPAIVDNPTQDSRLGPGPFTRELGVRFNVSQPTQLTAFRFWKTPGEGGTHIGKLWANGALVAQAQYVTESASGWQHQALVTPVQLQPGVTYTASVNANQAYALTPGGLASQIVSGSLLTIIGDNGVFSDEAGVLPMQSFSGSNYFVDLQVADDGTTPPPAPTDAGPRGGDVRVPPSSSVHVTFSRDLDVTTIGASSFKLTRQGDASPVPAVVTYEVTSRTATLTPSAPLLESSSYTANLAATIRAADGTPLANGVSWSFTTVDATAPDTTITASPPNPSASAAGDFSFTANDAGATFECALDSLPFTPCTSPVSHSALADGVHTFQVRAKDATGNVDPTPASFTWTVDLTAPDTVVTGGPSATAASTTATFTFTSTEPTGATYRCALDGSAFATCASGMTYQGLSVGPHTFQVAATDAVGNVDATPATQTWEINTAPPETTIVSGPTSPTREVSATFAFSSSKPDGRFECSLDGAVATACTSPYVAAGPLAAGTHTFTVTAIDAAGRADPTPATLSWTIDTTAPTVTITAGPPRPSSSSTAAFSFISSETGSAFECALDTVVFSACSSPQSYAGPLSDGSHTFQVRATDAPGNTGAAASYAWTVDTTPPTATITAPTSGATVSASVSVAANAADAGGVVGVRFRLDGAALGVEDTAAPYAITWDTKTATDGSHVLTAVARDAAGNTTTSTAVTVTVTNARPGLVAAYSFDEGGGSTLGDRSALGNTGAISGATWSAAGKYGGALSFDGIDDWVTVADSSSLDLTVGMTLEAWVKPSVTKSWPTVIHKERAPDLSYSLYANSSPELGDRPSMHLWIDGRDRNIRGGSTLPVGTWTHLAATYDGSAIRLYVNGAQVASALQTGPITTSTAPLRIGGNSVWPNEFFKGLIDEVRIYNRALDAAAINADMVAAIGGGSSAAPAPAPAPVLAPAPGLVAAFSFNAGAGGSVGDASGLGNAGAISGASWSPAGKFGGALSFDGVDDWVTVADSSSLDLTGAMTLEAWAKPSVTKNWPTLIEKERSSNPAYALYANGDPLYGDRPNLQLWLDGQAREVRGDRTLPRGVWTHVAATYDGSAMRVYVDGVEVGVDWRTGLIATSTGPLRIGGNSSSVNEFFSGLIDEVRIYNRALTAAEIKADMAIALP